MTRQLSICFLVLLFVTSCDRKDGVPFELPGNVHLSDYTLLSPFFIEQLNEAPVKGPAAWDDSLLNLTGIHTVTITAKGMKNPDDPSERIVFRFSEEGKLTKFEQTRYDLSKEPITVMECSGNQGKLTRYFGEHINHELKCEPDTKKILFIRNRSKEFVDSTIIFGSIRRPEIILERSGKYLAKINVILRESEPVRKFSEMISNLGLEETEIGNAEKIVTYVDNHYRPLRSYLLTNELIQTSMTAEWIYENHKKLIGYKRYVNTSLVKEYTFTYSDDKLMRSFEFNRIVYYLDYR